MVLLLGACDMRILTGNPSHKTAAHIAVLKIILYCTYCMLDILVQFYFLLMQVLQNMVKSCLQEADKCQATSIAFPALGAGNLEYPPKVVAKVMVQTIAAYLTTHGKTTSLKSVKLVMFTRPTLKEFDDVLKKLSTLTNMNSQTTTITEQQSDSVTVDDSGV